MDKKILQAYSVWAKEYLEKQVQISLRVIGIEGDKDIRASKVIGDFTVIEGMDTSFPKDLHNKRQEIISLIRTDGYQSVIESFAYTWFNRFIALRFMEVHGFLPHGFRVLSSHDGNVEPEILRNLNFVKDELRLDMTLCDKLKSEGDMEGLFRHVLFRQCNALADILPMLFSTENDYLALLLPRTLLKGETAITKLLEIPEEYFNDEVEVIGWLYQFYVADDRQEFRDAKLVTRDLIPTLTQVFTPDWIVRYMAQNSIGRLWLESYPNSPLRGEMKYYVADPEQPEAVQRKIETIKYRDVNPEDIKIIEPCCGSGHILVYAFDLLYKMYEEKGYQKRDIPTLILSKNLFGLEIDKRAAQLAAFALVMKARTVNPRFFTKGYYAAPQVYEIWDSRYFSTFSYKQQIKDLNLLSGKEADAVERLIEIFYEGKTVGSLLKVEGVDFQATREAIDKFEKKAVSHLFNVELLDKGVTLLKSLLLQAEVMTQKYDVMITNPPYLGISKMEPNAKEYLTALYPDSKSDMFAMFMEVPYVKKNGFRAIVNPDSWMFLVSYEQLRKNILHEETIVNMLHLGMGAFDATVQTTSFVLRNAPIGGNGVYYRLVDAKDKELTMLNGGGQHVIDCSSFFNIPGAPVAYWTSERLIKIFASASCLSDIGAPKQGLATGDNDRFLRQWFEPSIDSVDFACSSRQVARDNKRKWFPCNKGGEYHKWYGNNSYVVNWQDDGYEIRNFRDENGKLKSRPQNMDKYFEEGLTWSTLSSAKLSMRYSPRGHLFETKGSVCFFSDERTMFYVLGLLNSIIVNNILLILCPTLDFHEGPIGRIPIIIEQRNLDWVVERVESCISEAKDDWDSFETSWDFKKHPLI